jgi:deoxyribodipyrimidine photo-lyase
VRFITFMDKSPIIVWLRRDLRLADQPAFHAAASEGPVIPVYVLDDDGADERALGGAARWWLHNSLAALDDDLRALGSQLVLRRGRVALELAAIAEASGATRVHALHHYEPWEMAAEHAVGQALDLTLHDGNYLAPPLTVRTGGGQPYRIFTPFWRALAATMPPAEPLPRPDLRTPQSWPASDALGGWSLLPAKPDWAAGFAQEWRVGEAAARDQFEAFTHRVRDYDAARNLPAQDGSSRLSPYLHWGEISPGQVWHALDGKRGQGVTTFRSELAWRDFAQNLIAQFPAYGDRSYRPEYARMPWRDPERDEDAAADLRAWQRGRTGYPIVDAGMRQLWATGWMHNRVRMIAASFLVKHLLIDWRHGERWFWDTLVDADYANNAVNWQWIAGSGVDASLWSRIMAPLTQSAKFGAAEYIREWVPELAGLSDADIHDPPVRPAGYPTPLIEHRAARERALTAYRHARAS